MGVAILEYHCMWEEKKEHCSKSSYGIPSAQRPMRHIMWLWRVRREQVGRLSPNCGTTMIGHMYVPMFRISLLLSQGWEKIVQGHNLPFMSARVLSEISQKLSYVSGLCLRRWNSLFPTCNNCWIAYDIQISPTNGLYPLKFIHLRRQTILPHE